MVTRSGFTLIELSIVLVIIALLVGGILVGRDLIKAAEIRQIVSDVEKFSSAANTFREKYGCLPGDCTKAAELGFDAFTGSAANGDSVIGYSGHPACAVFPNTGCPVEHAAFWYQLSAASLISGSYPWPASGSDGTTCASGPSDCLTGNTFLCRSGVASPPARIVATAFFTTCGAPGGWSVVGSAVFPTNSSGSGTTTNYPPGMPTIAGHALAIGHSGTFPGTFSVGYSPGDLHAIDTKIDDGLPFSGAAVAMRSATRVNGMWEYSANGVASTTPNAPGNPACIGLDTTPARYNLQYQDSGPSFGRCGLIIKAGF